MYSALISKSKYSILTRKYRKDGSAFGYEKSLIQTSFDINKWAQRLGYSTDRIEELHQKGLIKEILKAGKRGIGLKWYNKYTKWHRTKTTRTGLLAQKVAMRLEKDWWGVAHPVTLLQVPDNTIIQVKTEETDGYNAFQIGAGVGRLKNMTKQLMGHYAKSGQPPKAILKEFKFTPEGLMKPGTNLTVRHFKAGQFVDLKAKSKAKGFQGVMKRHGFHGGNATHGQSLTHRSGGSTGMCQNPGRVHKGKAMPGKMGNANRMIKNARILAINTKDNIIHVIGGVPGPSGGWVRIFDSRMRPLSSCPPFPTFFTKDNLAQPKNLHWRYADPFKALREIDWELKAAESVATLKASQAAGEAEDGASGTTDPLKALAGED